MRTPSDIAIRPGTERAALSEAWRECHENPAAALAVAELCAARAAERNDPILAARALALSASVAMHRGEMERAARLMAAAQGGGGTAADPRTAADIAAMSSQLAFLTGDYAEAVQAARQAIAFADASDDLRVRIRVRRVVCMVYGNLQLPESRPLIDELLALAITTDEPWEEAVSRNDLACALSEEGELAAAEAQTVRALRLLGPAEYGNTFAIAVLLSTRADVRLADGRPEEALADAEASLTLLWAVPEPDPYVLAATVRAQLQALVTLGRPDAARSVGAAALAQIGDRVPHTRGRLMVQLAQALRETGFEQEATETLAAAQALHRGLA